MIIFMKRGKRGKMVKTNKLIKLILLVSILLSCVVYAGYDTRWNPWTSRLQYVKDSNLSGEKLYLGEANVINNLTVNGYLAVATASNIINVSNQSIVNVTDNLVYKMNNFTDIVSSSLNAYSYNGSVLTLINSDNYTFNPTEGQWALSVTAYNGMNVTLDYARFYLSVNLSTNDLYVAGEVIANINWTMLQNYPVACPSGAITQLGDSVTCSEPWLNITGVVNLTGNLTGLDYVTANFFVGDGSRLGNHSTYNASYANDYLERNATTNLNMSDKNITNVADLYVDTIHGGSPINFADSINLTFNGTTRNITNANSITASYLLGEGSGLTNLTAFNESYLERNATTDLNMSNNDVWDLNKISFKLGEYFDNLVDGWIRLVGNLNVLGHVNASGNVTASNVWVPSYVGVHTNAQQAVTAGGLWVNVSFNDSATAIFQRITHTYNDATNDTFTIADTGIYALTYALDIVDSAASPDAHVVARFVKNGGIEIEGTLFEIDTDKQNKEEELSLPEMFVSLNAGDTIKLQFTSDDTTVTILSQGTFGDHPDSAILTIKRIA